MVTHFSINDALEESLVLTFDIEAGNFTADGQSFIVRHVPGIAHVDAFTSWSFIANGLSTTNYFNIDYRWTFDNQLYSNWQPLSVDFDEMPSFPTNSEVWIEFRFTAVIADALPIQLVSMTVNGTRLPFVEATDSIVLGPGETRVYMNQDTYKVFAITGYNIAFLTGSESDMTIRYRYTATQGRHWSDWTFLTIDNLKKSRFERLKFTNFQFSFTNNGTGNVVLEDLELLGDFQNITANYKTTAKYGLKSQCLPKPITPTPSGPCIDGCADKVDGSCCSSCAIVTPGLNETKDCGDACSTSMFKQLNDTTLFQNQIDLQQQLNQYVEATNSWAVQYFLTDPDKKGTDHFLHTHTLPNVIAMKDMRIIVPDNAFPTENVTFSGFNLDMIQSFEIHIMKDTFKRVFGVEFRPSKKDYIYFCNMNQLWEVEQMFPSRGLMLAETYYRVMLKKYDDNANRRFANTSQGQAAKDVTDSLVKYTTLNGLFDIDTDEYGAQIAPDKDSLGVVNPSQQITDTTVMNHIKGVAPSVKHIVTDIWNATLTVSKQHYDMPAKSPGVKLVEYNYKDGVVGKADNRAVSFWFKPELYDPTHDTLIFSNYDYTNNKGYKVNLFDGLFTFTFNQTVYSLPIADTMVNGEWRCFLVSMDQIKKKMDMVVYKRQSEDGMMNTDSKLITLKTRTFDIVPDAFTHGAEMFIGGNDTMSNQGNLKRWYITNLFVFNQPIAKPKRNLVLNQSYVNDAHLSILVDDASPQVKLPQYGNI